MFTARIEMEISCKFINLTNTFNLSHSHYGCSGFKGLRTPGVLLYAICYKIRPLRPQCFESIVQCGIYRTAQHRALPLLARTANPGAHRARSATPQERPSNAPTALTISPRHSPMTKLFNNPARPQRLATRLLSAPPLRQLAAPRTAQWRVYWLDAP